MVTLPGSAHASRVRYGRAARRPEHTPSPGTSQSPSGPNLAASLGHLVHHGESFVRLAEIAGCRVGRMRRAVASEPATLSLRDLYILYKTDPSIGFPFDFID